MKEENEQPLPHLFSVRIILKVRIMDLVLREFEGKEIIFTKEGMINATQTAKQFNKDVRAFTRSKEYKTHSQLIAEELNCDVRKLHITFKGNSNEEQGTFFHPELTIVFARWLSPKFGRFCDKLAKAFLLADNETQKEIINTLTKEKKEYYDKYLKEMQQNAENGRIIGENTWYNRYSDDF